jgi:hypothetical protein
MTSEMAFECLFVSSDADLFRIAAGILRQLSISIEICLRSSNAFDILGTGTTDLVVIDWEGEESAELVHRIWTDQHRKKPTIIAVLPTRASVPGAHLTITKPVSSESGEQCFRAAYSRMLIDHRRHARHVLVRPVIATAENGREMLITVIDIGDGGVGLSTKEKLEVGEVLSFRLLLPDTTREILIQARIVWGREYSRFGCEFVRIPPTDLIILHDWLTERCRVKKPLVAV